MILIALSYLNNKNQSYFPEDLGNTSQDQRIILSDKDDKKFISTNEIGFSDTRGVKIVLDNPNSQLSPDIKVFKVALNSTDVNNSNQFMLADESLTDKSGKSTIRHGDTEVLISNSRITNETLLFVTSTVSTQGQGLYVKEVGDSYAIISIDSPLTEDIIFNWFIDDNQIYHSIL